jgi:glutamyl-tRNA synthetase
MSDAIRVRFSPSPTGYLHVGGARTALFNWLFARKVGGVFILRIEDTDLERSSAEMTQVILDALKWLGLDWDEGPIFQSHRIELHKEAAERLLKNGEAYCCLCEAGKHDKVCRDRNLREAQGAAVRFRVPESAVTFRDAVMGEITVESDTIEDFVLLRSNSQPTYHLGVVVDDIDMRVTHIIRGADHISNTPKQILLYRALGAPLPQFAHVPLILGPDKAKLSKRHTATSVAAYQEQGIVPEALRNFLALLGWAPGNDQEIFDIPELIRAFSLEGVSKANAVFNPEKLAWFNAQYIARLPHETLVAYVKPEYQKAGLWRDSFETTESEWFHHLLDVLRPRSKTIVDFPRQSKFCIQDQIGFDPVAVEKLQKDPTAAANLSKLADRLEALTAYTHESLETVIRDLAGDLGIKPSALMNAARIALTGQNVSPGIFDVMLLVGQTRSIERLRSARIGIRD